MDEKLRAQAVDFIVAQIGAAKHKAFEQRREIAERIVGQLEAAVREAQEVEMSQKLGTLISDDGFRWDLTDEDALWLGRAAVGEGPESDAIHVASTMLRRLAFVSDNQGRKVWSTLTELLRAYSQPINPDWEDRGTEQQIARRERIRTLEWSEIPEGIRRTVLEVLSGRRRLTMQGAVHFADERVSGNFLENNEGSYIVGRGANVFVGLRSSRHYPDPTIEPARSNGTIYLVGDSHMEALGPRLAPLLAAKGWDVLGYTFNRGWSTASYLSEGKLGEVVRSAGAPDAVLVELGGNDRPRSRAEYTGQLTEAVAQIGSGVRKFWVGPSTVRTDIDREAGGRHSQNADWQSEILPGLGVTWIDGRPMTTTGHRSDGVHYTMDAYERWAEKIARVIPSPARRGGLVSNLTPFGEMLVSLLAK